MINNEILDEVVIEGVSEQEVYEENESEEQLLASSDDISFMEQPPKWENI